MKRNQFIKAMTATMLGYPLLKNMVSDDQSELLESGQSNSWAVIKKQFPRSKNWLDLNHAGLNRSPKVVLEAQKKYQKKMRTAPSMHQRELWKLMKIGREKLSKHIHCSVDELALVSNTTEAMNTAINGIPLRKGSEVILGFYDYPHIRFQWEARAKRDQLKLKYVDIGSFPKSKNEIIAYYIKAVTKRTKVIQLTQIINYNGIHVPCEEIIAQLPEHVVYKIVDGAQSVSHIPVNLQKMKCTHFGSSLHKWSGACFGTGLLYVQKDFISRTNPLFPSPANKKDDITKFHSSGSRDFANYSTIKDSMDFQSQFTIEEKNKRLIELRNYWQKGCGQFKLFQPDEAIASGIGIVSFKDPSKVVMALREKGIHVTQIDRGDIHGIRVSANICHDEKDLDHFIAAMNTIQS